MKIPWRQFKSKPVEILIKSVFILVTPKQANEWNLKE